MDYSTADIIDSINDHAWDIADLESDIVELRERITKLEMLLEQKS